MGTRNALLAMLLGSVLSAPALADPPKTQNGYFVDSTGATLYTYDKDAEGKSNCAGKCAQNWPPALAEADEVASGDWTLVESHDGKPQWAYKGQPLYRFIKDKNPGDTTGDGVGDVWHLAKP